MRNLIVLPDGRELFSGSSGAAILSLQLTQSVNSRQELTLGSACAAMLEARLLLEETAAIEAGQELTLYKVDDRQERQLVGIFVAQSPVRAGRSICRLTAFDRMVYADRDLSGWLRELTGWPYTLQELAEMVCRQCGLELTGEALPNAEQPVQAFSASDITGRELLQWIGEAAGRFCRITPRGQLEFAWYTPAGRISLGPEFAWGIDSCYGEGMLTLDLSGSLRDADVTLEGAYLEASFEDGNVTLTGPVQQYYFMGGLEKADYTVAPVQRLQIRANANDVGTVWPETEGTVNTYIIEGNPLLTAQSAESLQQLAQDLYEQLQAVTYTPCKVSLPADMALQPGQILQVTDSDGKAFSMYIMQRTQTGRKDTLECTGSASRETAVSVNNRYIKSLSGKVLELRTDVDGLAVKNADTTGRVAQLELDISGLHSRVSRQENGLTQLSSLQQTAGQMQLQLQSLEENSGRVITSTGYSFTEDGLKIKKSGQEMESLVDHTGLYVSRGGQVILQAGNRGVTAVDVTVGNYLAVGEHARFEDYQDGTACFYI